MFVVFSVSVAYSLEEEMIERMHIFFGTVIFEIFYDGMELFSSLLEVKRIFRRFRSVRYFVFLFLDFNFFFLMHHKISIQQNKNNAGDRSISCSWSKSLHEF